MKTVLRLVAIVLLLVLLGGGAFYVYHWLESRPPEPDAPPSAAVPAAPVEAPATEDLPTPELSEAPPPPAAEAIATLAQTERTVKAKRASELAWNDAQPRMGLYENDAVRTFDKASASIAFGPNDIVEVDQNALVIIRKREARAEEMSLALLSGDFLDSLAAKPEPERAVAIEKEAARREVTIKRAPGTPPSSKTRVAFKTLPDRSTTVAAVSGSLQLATPGQAPVTLKEKMVARITPEGIVLKPRDLPGVPSLEFPRDGATYAFQRKVPRVDLKWAAVPGARHYRVVVATDPAFRRIFVDDRVGATTLAVRNLQPGAYYWRVRAQDADGFEGAYSAVRSVKATYDDAPPPLAILSPPEMFVSPRPDVEVKGRTDHDARVRVNGQRVEVASDGTFVTKLVLKEGVNLVTVEAVDPAGNSEYGKRLITYKGAKRSSAASVQGD